MNNRIVKIIATSFFPKTVREDTILSGDPPVYTLHSQNFTNTEDIKKLILFNIEKENQCDPGLPVDMVFVNNDVGNVSGNMFVKNLNGKTIKNGKIISIENNNNGWSYGAFSKGFKELKNIYDYFIFAEDDMIITRDNYAKISYETFENNKNCGFVSYTGITNHVDKNISNENLIHAHGATGFSSKKILEKVYNKYGKLPHCSFSDKKYYKDIIIEGEIKFTNVIFKMGYSLVEAPEKLFEPAYDLMRGINKPWKPPKFIKYKWIISNKIRKNIYKLLIYFKLYNAYRFIRKFLFKF